MTTNVPVEKRYADDKILNVPVEKRNADLDFGWGHHAPAMERRYAAAVTSGSMAIPVRPTFAHVPAV